MPDYVRQFPEIPDDWRDDALAEKWQRVRALRRVVTGALEVERAAKRIGSSLQAHPLIFADASYRDAARGLELADLCITSAAQFCDGDQPSGGFSLDDVPGVRVAPGMAEGNKCERCWKVLPEVGTVSGHDDLCNRCADAVEHHAAAAE